ncbi:hypothetical protein CIK72_06630 [Brachybacterium alimentarium]|nr:hypothetical protein CIK72_06630 [Brachybacterium alimentarium]
MWVASQASGSRHQAPAISDPSAGCGLRAAGCGLRAADCTARRAATGRRRWGRAPRSADRLR